MQKYDDYDSNMEWLVAENPANSYRIEGFSENTKNERVILNEFYADTFCVQKVACYKWIGWWRKTHE